MFRKVDLTPYHETKNNLTYVNWARAWSTAQDLIGDHLQISWHGSTEYRPDGSKQVLDYIKVPGGTASVCCSALVGGEKYAECTLAVMDYRNSAVENPTSVDLQNSRQRCQTKLLAMLGLGLYLWENGGEIKPTEGDPKKKAAPKKKEESPDTITSEEASKELQAVVNDLWERGWKPEGNFAKEIKGVVSNPDVVAPEEIQKLIEAVRNTGDLALKLHDKKETESDG